MDYAAQRRNGLSSNDGNAAALPGPGKGLLVACRVVLADRGEGLVLVADEGGRPEVVVRVAGHLGRPAQQGLEPGLLEHDADGAGQGRVGACRHVQGQHFPLLDQVGHGRQAALQARKRGRKRFPLGERRLLAGGKAVGRRWRTEDVGHVGLVEKGEEHTDAFNDRRAELDVQIAPVLGVPKLDSIEAFSELLAGASARFEFRVNSKLHELVLKLLGPRGGGLPGREAPSTHRV